MNKDLQKDAQIKFEKMLEMANDIDKNGTTGGDPQMHHLVMSGILSTENDVLIKMMEDALGDDSHPEIFHTIIMGVFLAKKNHEAAASYVQNIFKDVNIITESLDKKEALLLAADSIISALNEGNSSCRESFITLFCASCRENSTAFLADKLLERFLNVLPRAGEVTSQILLEISSSSDYDLNSRLVAVDILSRGKVEGFPEVLEKIILDLNDEDCSPFEKLYLLDVATKALNVLATSGVKFNYSNILSFLNGLQLNIKTEDEISAAIIKRIEKRLKNINDIFNSRN